MKKLAGLVVAISLIAAGPLWANDEPCRQWEFGVHRIYGKLEWDKQKIFVPPANDSRYGEPRLIISFEKVLSADGGLAQVEINGHAIPFSRIVIKIGRKFLRTQAEVVVRKCSVNHGYKIEEATILVSTPEGLRAWQDAINTAKDRYVKDTERIINAVPRIVDDKPN